MKNLNIRKQAIIALMAIGVLSLKKDVYAEENIKHIYQEVSDSTDLIDKFIISPVTPENTDEITFTYIGDFDLATYNGIVLDRIASNYIDATNENYIPREKIYEECFNDYHFEEYNDDVNMVVNCDGTILGYMKKIKFYSYNGE